jgi:hypothetical protein
VTDTRALVAAWWEALDDAVRDRVRAHRDGPLPYDLVTSLVAARVPTGWTQFAGPQQGAVVYLPENVRAYLDELDEGHDAAEHS